jgi:hypothetical protein
MKWPQPILRRPVYASELYTDHLIWFEGETVVTCCYPPPSQFAFTAGEGYGWFVGGTEDWSIFGQPLCEQMLELRIQSNK